MLALICGIMIILVAVIAALNVINIPLAFGVIGILGGLAMGFGPLQLVEFCTPFVSSTLLGMVALMGMSVIFFQALMKSGFFDMLVYYVYKIILDGKKNTLWLYITTIIITSIFFLSGDYSAGYLVVITALRALYDAVKVSRVKLLCLTWMLSAAWCPLPWNIITLMVTAAAGVDPQQNFIMAIPLMAACMIGIIITIVIWSIQDAKQSNNAVMKDCVPDPRLNAAEKPDYRLNRFIPNLVLFVAALVVVSLNIMSTWFVFMVAAFIAIILNGYYKSAAANAVFQSGAGMLMTMFSLLVPVNVFLGIITGSGALSEMVSVLQGFIPEVLLRGCYLIFAAIIIFAFQAIPYQVYLALITFFCATATALGGNPYVISALFSAILALGTCCSPTVSFTHVSSGAAELSYRDGVPTHLKYGHICLALVIVTSIVLHGI